MRNAMYIVASMALTLNLGACKSCGSSQTPNTAEDATVSRSSPGSSTAHEGAADKGMQAFDAATLTPAPRRVLAVAELDAPVQEVWSYISNHDNLVEYSNGLLQSADIDRSKAKEHNGVGTERACQVGKDRFVERIVHFRAPHSFAYTAFENTWGLENHLAAVVLKPAAEGRTRLEWSLYFDMASPEAVAMMTKNMTGMMQEKLLPFFTQKFGGKVLASAE